MVSYRGCRLHSKKCLRPSQKISLEMPLEAQDHFFFRFCHWRHLDQRQCQSGIERSTLRYPSHSGRERGEPVGRRAGATAWCTASPGRTTTRSRVEFFHSIAVCHACQRLRYFPCRAARAPEAERTSLTICFFLLET